MTTLLNSHGARRCDAKCYDAQGPDCFCVCGGMNHGVGATIARANTCALTGKTLKQVQDRGGLIPDELRKSQLFW